MTSLEALYLAAWVDGLQQRCPQPAVRPAEPFHGLARLSTPVRRYSPLQRHD